MGRINRVFVAVAVGLLFGGCGMEVTDENVGGSSAALTTMQTRAQVHEATLHANHGGYAWDRQGTYYDGRGETREEDMGSTDNSGRVSWKLGPWTETWDGTFNSGEPYNQVTTCTYGWCGSLGGLGGTTNGCVPGDDDEAEWGYSYGACNSSAWGQRFAGYLEGVDRPVGSGDMVHSDYASGATGTTTFGYHPYWGVVYNGECRIYQGWSYTTHSCGSSYVLDEAASCGDGFCDDTAEDCGSCAADCGACPACGNGTCDWSEDCGSCAADCGECPPGPPPACGIHYSASGTSNASYSDTDTEQIDVVLQAGVEYTFSTCTGGDSSDTYLRLHLDGGQVAYNDDGCGSGYRSKIVYTPSTSGTYVLSMGCYSSNSCSGPVNVSPGDDTGCTGTGGGGGGCDPVCTGDMCGQADGCGGTCPDTDLSTCGLCGNPGPDCSGEQCGQPDGCGGTCPATDIDTCGMCGNPACGGGGDLYEPDLSGSTGSTRSFTFDGTNPTIAITGGSGDADLYVKLGSEPSTYSYDCRPYRWGNEETCNLSGTGTFYIQIRGYDAYSGVTLTGTSN